MPLLPVSPADVDDLRAFLVAADLTLAGLDDPAVRLWIERDAAGLAPTSVRPPTPPEETL